MPDEDESTHNARSRLVEEYECRGVIIHDANIVATALTKKRAEDRYGKAGGLHKVHRSGGSRPAQRDRSRNVDGDGVACLSVPNRQHGRPGNHPTCTTASHNGVALAKHDATEHQNRQPQLAFIQRKDQAIKLAVGLKTAYRDPDCRDSAIWELHRRIFALLPQRPSLRRVHQHNDNAQLYFQEASGDVERALSVVLVAGEPGPRQLPVSRQQCYVAGQDTEGAGGRQPATDPRSPRPWGWR